MTMQYDVESYHNTDSGVAVPYRTRLKGVVISPTTSTTYNIAIANNVPQSGTYDIPGTTTCTVTIAGHGVALGSRVWLQFATGSAVSNTYVVTAVTINTFTVTTGVLTTSGNVTGKAHAYSTLMYFTKYLTAPALGAPYATDAQIVALQNTSSWAFDPFYASEQGDSYSDSSKPQFGLGAYSNPQEVYTSPVLHTVRLQNLTGGTTYEYRVAGSERLFNFSMPVNGSLESPYPFVLALTADLGQTAASKANVHNLLQIATSEGPGRGVALLSGDLSYADGYGPRWDSYARMMEPLASAVPVMVTGGNHEFGDGEAWTACARRAPLESFLSPHTWPTLTHTCCDCCACLLTPVCHSMQCPAV